MRIGSWCLGTFTLLLLAACGDGHPTSDLLDPTPTAASTVSDESEGRSTALATTKIDEDELEESPDSRDPFRPFLTGITFICRDSAPGGEFPLDQLRLTGIVTGAARRALLTDPTGFGWILETGQRVAKMEVVKAPHSDAEVDMFWRVDRIRRTDVVFIRDDPAFPEIPPTTRLVRLHPDS